jgi:flagellar assembly protein FliH
LSPSALPLRQRVLSASDAERLTRAPIAAQLVPPAIPAGPATSGDLERRLARAREEGFAAGQAEALAGPELAAIAARAAAVAELCATLGAAAERLASDRASLADEMTAEIASLAAEVVASVLTLPASETLGGALERAIAVAPSRQALTIRVHPDAAVSAAELAGALTSEAVTVIADPSVDPRGCVVEAGPTTIDAQITTAVARAADVFAALATPVVDDETTA